MGSTLILYFIFTPFDSSSFSSTSSHSVLRLSGRSKEQKNYIISIKKPQLTINCRWRRKTARHYISTAADMIRARSCWHYGALETLASPCPLSGTAPTPRPPCILPVCSTWSNRQVNVTDLDDFATFSSCWTSAFWIKGSIVCFSDAYFREITQMGTEED